MPWLRLLSLILVAGSGCSGLHRPDPRLVTYDAAVHAFATEALSLCRYIDDAPDEPLLSQKVRAVVDLYTRIPDPPDGRQAVTANAQKAKAILQDSIEPAHLAASWAGLLRKPDRRSDALRAEYQAHMDECLGACRKISKEARSLLETIEQAITPPPP